MPFIHVYIKLGAHDHGAGALLHPHREAVAGLRYLNSELQLGMWHVCLADI